MREVWEKIQKKYPQLIIEDCDIDEHPERKEQYQIIEYPTYLFVNDQDQELERLSGDVDEREILIRINKYL